MSSNQTINLDLIKYPAQKGPFKGSILLNFGGPGQDGLDNMIAYAPIQGLYYHCWPMRTSAFTTFACAQWSFEAKERYEGDFHVKTKNPILSIGNSFGPVTPLVSAQNMSASFEGSVLLQHNGYGHFSFSHPSSCTDKYIADYFLTGALPEDGAVCEPNEKIFRMTQ